MKQPASFWSVMIAMLALALAGCVGGNAGDDLSQTKEPGTPGGSNSPPPDAPAPEPTEEYGALVVRTVNEELEPVGSAHILLADNDWGAITDAGGRATFNGLESGRYTVLASKPGHVAREEAGRIAQVEAGTTTEVTLTLIPVQIVTGDTAYSETLPFDGLVACSVYIGLVGEIDQCGKGVTINGQTYLRDPNENSTHLWEIDNQQVKAFWVELEWTASNTLLGSHMRAFVYGYKDCSATTPAETGCIYRESFAQFGRGGASPVRWLVTDGEDKNITGRFKDNDNFVFPHPMTVEVEPVLQRLVEGYNVGYNAMYQQRYDLYISIFYGEEPEPGFTALPPS